MLRAQYIPVSRLHLSRYVIGSSKNAPHAALAGKRAGCRPGRASPRGTHGTCSTNTQLKSIAFAITRWSHTHCGRASTLETLERRASSRGALARARNTQRILWLFSINIRIIMCGKAGKPSEFSSRSSPQHTTYILWLFSINIRIIMCGKAGKPSEFRARSRQKAPTPCTNELRQAFTSTARQDGFLERRERERESCLDT